MDFVPGDSPFQRVSRKLMAYHCSGSDTVLGSVNVGGSVVILLLIGFVVGFGLAWFVFWRRERKRVLLELEYRERFADQVKKEVPDVGSLVQTAQLPVYAEPQPAAGAGLVAKLPATAATLGSGPLALGASQALPTKQPPPPARSSSGNPFAGVEPYNVVRNPTSSLDCSVDASGPLARSSVARTASGGIELRSSGGLIPAVIPPPAPAGGQSFARRTTDPGAGAEAAHARNDTVVVNPLAASGASDYVAAVARTTSLDRQPSAAAPVRTASGNPFTDTKQAQKQELLEQVRSEEYDAEDLDPEWQELLQELDGRMRAAGKPPLSSKERAVAIRSLIVATASQSADAALCKAVQDVEVFRRAQQYMH